MARTGLVVFVVFLIAMICFTLAGVPTTSRSEPLDREASGETNAPAVAAAGTAPQSQRHREKKRNADEAEDVLADTFIEETMAGTRNAEPANCPDDLPWIVPWLAEGFTSDTKRVMVNVGANKGYVMGSWISLLTSDLHAARWVVPWITLHAASLPSFPYCGGCCDCLETMSPHAATGKKADIFAFEGSPSNAAFLNDAFFSKEESADMGVKPPVANDVGVYIVHSAVGKTPGTAVYLDAGPGAEMSSLAVSTVWAGFQKYMKNVTVPVVSMDSYFAEKKDPTTGKPLFLDLLATDTEGHDYQAFLGAQRLLKEERVGIYIFELFATPEENGFVLEELTNTFGFRCFFPLRRKRTAPQSVVIPHFLSYEAYKQWRDTYKPPSGVKLATKRRIDEPDPDKEAPFPLHGWYNALCVHTKHNPSLLQLLRGLTKKARAEPSRPRNRFCPIEAYLKETKPGVAIKEKQRRRDKLIKRRESKLRKGRDLTDLDQLKETNIGEEIKAAGRQLRGVTRRWFEREFAGKPHPAPEGEE